MVTASDVTALLGRTVSPQQGAAVIQVVTSMARSYTRDEGFTDGEPCDDIAYGAILPAVARLVSNPSQLNRAVTVGPESASFGAWTGWTLSEKLVLDRYRVKAR